VRRGNGRSRAVGYGYGTAACGAQINGETRRLT
jgi:hypothetical protein